MTLPESAHRADPASSEQTPRSGRPRIVWVFTAVAIVMFLVGLAGGGFQGKLGEVQKNDNSSFLPDSADSTKVAKEQEKFNDVQSIPGFVVYQRKGGITEEDKAAIAQDIPLFAKVKGVAGDEVGKTQISKGGDVATVSVPLIGKKDGKSAQGDKLVKTENNVLKIARADAPKGLAVHSAGAGGLLVAFIDAFQGLDGTLLLAAGLVVIIILLFVYRSPVLWFFPLFSAGLALGAAALVIYPLAKSGAITLNGQSQGILSVLVIGAGTDYALLLISRYREELHTYESRVEAMIAAWKGAAPPIAASAITVILGLICLSFAELNSTAGLGPVCSIGIAATVLVMLTVLPLLLVLAGRWIFWPKRPVVDHRTDILEVHGAWGRFSQKLADRHRMGWLGATAVLAICVIGILGLKTDGLSTQDGFTTTPDAIVGQRIYDANFSKGAGAPAQILAKAARVDDVIAAAKKVDGIDPQQVCVAVDYAKVAELIKKSDGRASALGGDRAARRRPSRFSRRTATFCSMRL